MTDRITICSTIHSPPPYTFELFDRILVLQKGRLVEQGSHRELRALGGLYARLAELQERGLASL